MIYLLKKKSFLLFLWFCFADIRLSSNSFIIYRWCFELASKYNCFQYIITGDAINVCSCIGLQTYICYCNIVIGTGQSSYMGQCTWYAFSNYWCIVLQSCKYLFNFYKNLNLFVLKNEKRFFFQAKYISRSTEKTVLPSFFHNDSWRGTKTEEYKHLLKDNNNSLTPRNGTLKTSSVTNLLLNGNENHFSVNPNNKLLFV